MALASDLADLESKLEAYRASMVATRKAQRALEKAVTNAELALVREKEGVAMGPAADAAAAAAAAQAAQAAQAAASNTTDSQDQAGDVAETLRSRVDVAREVLPRPGALFFRLLLGSVNIRMLSDEERWQYKEEYEGFKNLATQAAIVSIAAVYAAHRPWLDTLLHALVLYYYFSITAREHVLLVNGSTIRRWWRRHHYLTIVLTLVLMTWPPSSPSWHVFRPTFVVFVMYIACLQILQYRYQRARLQVLRSMGHADGSRDVVNSDTAQLHWSQNMLFLIPFLLVGQLAQLYLAWFLYNMYASAAEPIEWQVPFAGLTYLALGIGNLFTTLRVVWWRRNSLWSKPKHA